MKERIDAAMEAGEVAKSHRATAGSVSYLRARSAMLLNRQRSLVALGYR